jgi:hypothetical protein
MTLRYCEVGGSLTGAIYSSVPTKEFDDVTGSANTTGPATSFVLFPLFFGFTGGIICMNAIIHFVVVTSTSDEVNTEQNHKN